MELEVALRIVSGSADLDVTYLQLFLFVWHSFTVETRRALLNQCVRAVMRAAQARE